MFPAAQKINSRGKGGKYLEKENIFFAEEKNNGEEKGGSFARDWSIQMIVFKRPFHPDENLQKAGPTR